MVFSAPQKICTKRTPRSTSRRASRHCRPKGPDVFVIELVELLRELGLAAQIGDLGRAELQAGGEFVGSDAGFEFAVAGALREVLRFSDLQKIARRLLRSLR